MSWKHLFARKDLEMLLAEMAGEHRLHRVLGPVALTSLGVGCIIGAGIFVMTGRAAAQDAGPAVIISFAVAALGCALAALCYAEFAAMAPVAGSAYTYAYTTLGEIFAWIIGWDLILEYAMGCATVASAWSGYLNEFLVAVSGGWLRIPWFLLSDPFTKVDGMQPWLNLPSVFIMVLVTTVLVVGIRESAGQRHVGNHQAGGRGVRRGGGLGLRAAGQLDRGSLFRPGLARGTGVVQSRPTTTGPWRGSGGHR